VGVIHQHNNSIWNTGELPHQWKESVIVHVYFIVQVNKKGDKVTVIFIVGCHCYQLNTFFRISFFHG
jgi:hypothetical protein